MILVPHKIVASYNINLEATPKTDQIFFTSQITMSGWISIFMGMFCAKCFLVGTEIAQGNLCLMNAFGLLITLAECFFQRHLWKDAGVNVDGMYFHAVGTGILMLVCFQGATTSKLNTIKPFGTNNIAFWYALVFFQALAFLLTWRHELVVGGFKVTKTGTSATVLRLIFPNTGSQFQKLAMMMWACLVTKDTNWNRQAMRIIKFFSFVMIALLCGFRVIYVHMDIDTGKHMLYIALAYLGAAAFAFRAEDYVDEYIKHGRARKSNRSVSSKRSKSPSPSDGEPFWNPFGPNGQLRQMGMALLEKSD